MVLETHTYTAEEFDEFLTRPENENRVFELINGEPVEVPPGRTLYSELAQIITVEVRNFCKAHHLPCYTSGEAGTYDINGNHVAPDFAYKNTPMNEEYPDPVPPLWVVEVISPSDKPYRIRNKRQIYVRAGILLWEVYRESLSVDVYAPGLPVQSYSAGDTLTVGDILPGFTIAVNDIFGLE